MNKLTRRKFLLNSAGVSTSIVIGADVVTAAIPFDSSTIQCNHCGVQSVPAFSHLLKNIVDYHCPNCGVNLSKDIFNNCQEKKIECTELHNPACCQIPFPNPEKVTTTEKPLFSMNDIVF